MREILTMIALVPFLIFFLWIAGTQIYLLVCEYQESKARRAVEWCAEKIVAAEKAADAQWIARIIQMQTWAPSDPVIDEMCES